MKLKGMRPGRRYIVTKCANGGSLKVGDSVYLDPQGGKLFNRDACGWMNEADWKRIRIGEVEIDRGFYGKTIAKMKEKIRAYEGILNDERS